MTRCTCLMSGGWGWASRSPGTSRERWIGLASLAAKNSRIWAHCSIISGLFALQFLGFLLYNFWAFCSIISGLFALYTLAYWYTSPVYIPHPSLSSQGSLLYWLKFQFQSWVFARAPCSLAKKFHIFLNDVPPHILYLLWCMYWKCLTNHVYLVLIPNRCKENGSSYFEPNINYKKKTYRRTSVTKTLNIFYHS